MMKQYQWHVPRDLIARSVRIMAPHGRLGNEGLAIWLGKEIGAGAQVTHVVELKGPGFETSPGRLSISIAGMSALTDLAEAQDVYLIGQIHSHPKNYVDLSWVDKAYGIRVPNYLSLVCPHYAQFAETKLHACGAHVFEQGAYRQMNSMEAADRIRTVSTHVQYLVLEVAA